MIWGVDRGIEWAYNPLMNFWSFPLPLITPLGSGFVPPQSRGLF